MAVTPFRRPPNWDNLHADDAERVVREWAQDDERIIFGPHAFERMAERGFVRADAVRILRTGQARQPELDEETGDWKVIIALPFEGTREAGVVTALLRAEKSLFVITVEWMD